MKTTPPNRERITNGLMGTDSSSGMNGAFLFERKGVLLFCIVSEGNSQLPWEHVSITVKGVNRCPNWEEMCFIKDTFWNANETVLQFHPKEIDYVNVHEKCLHLWKKIGVDHELPPTIMV